MTAPSGPLPLSAIETAAEGLVSERSEDYQRMVFELPDWFDDALDPQGIEYRMQQLRLWRQISGRQDYVHHLNELTSEIGELDAINQPAFYASGESSLAGEHLIALGHLVYRSGLRRGSTALEYGAGFGQITLALARLGVTVQTVDTGDVPEGQRFDLVYFYEAFHHCLEFQDLIPRLRDLLAPGGRVILAGEPIVPDHSPSVPYPWGVHLDVEKVVEVRERGWMDLGFQESYLFGLFVRAGFVWERYTCPPSPRAELWVLSRRPDRIDLATHSLTTAEEVSWHGPEPTGRWTRYRSWLNVDESADSIELSFFNHHPVSRRVTLACAGFTSLDVPGGERTRIRIPQSGGQLAIECEPLIPRSYGNGDDSRELGIFVETLTY